VRPSHQLGENDAGLRKSVIIALQAGKDQVELLVLDGCSKGTGSAQRV